MSCSKDLHSVYIDDEMPENFVSKYEDLLKNDVESRADFEKMKKIHDLLNFDAESEASKIDDEFVQKSFERLQNKMRFSQNVQFAEPKKNIASFVKFPLSFAAAAAVFAVVFVPLNKGTVSENIAINAISHTEMQPIAEVDVKIDGNIASEKLPEVFSVMSKNEKSLKLSEAVAEIENENLAAVNESVSSSAVLQKTVRASAMVSNSMRNFSSNMTSVDVFRSKFARDDIARKKVTEFDELQLDNKGN